VLLSFSLFSCSDSGGGTNKPIPPVLVEKSFQTISVGSSSPPINKVAVLSDGSWVAVGKAPFNIGKWKMRVWKFTSDNALDSSFYGNGIFDDLSPPGIVSSQGNAVVATADGGFIVVGETVSANDTGMTIWKFAIDSTGQLVVDENFALNGRKLDSLQQSVGKGICLDATGWKVVGLSGLAMTVWKYTENLTNSTYNVLIHQYDTGAVLSVGSGNDISCLLDGGFIVAGVLTVSPINQEKATLWKYLENGTLDTTFASNGLFTENIAQGESSRAKRITKTPDNGWAVLGEIHNDIAIWKFTSNLELDTGFYDKGLFRYDSGNTDNAYSILSNSNGEMLAVGYSSLGSSTGAMTLLKFTNNHYDGVYNHSLGYEIAKDIAITNDSNWLVVGDAIGPSNDYDLAILEVK